MLKEDLGEVQTVERFERLFKYLSDVLKLVFKPNRDIYRSGNLLLFQHEILELEGIYTFKNFQDEIAWLLVYKQDVSTSFEFSKLLDLSLSILYRMLCRVLISPISLGISLGLSYLISDILIGSRQDSKLYYKYLKYSVDWYTWYKKRKVQKIYEELFRLRKELENDESLELVWGYGLLLWKNEEYNIKYPLITQRMKLEFYPTKGCIAVLPDEDSAPQIELNVLRDTGLGKEGKISEFSLEEYLNRDEMAEEVPLIVLFSKALKEIASRLSPDSIIVPSSEVKDLKLESRVKIVNTWVLFVRKRQQDAVMRDIETYLSLLKYSKDLPDTALKIFLMEPEEKGLKKPRVTLTEWDSLLDENILFPLSTNDEQLKVLEYLEERDGVKVWGPPGTGKSHTIVNLISHFMAQGKRVLVTSQKDQALLVLRDKLPDPLKDFCINVLLDSKSSTVYLKRATEKLIKIRSEFSEEELELEKVKLEEKLKELRHELGRLKERIKELSTEQFYYIDFNGRYLILADAVKELGRNRRDILNILGVPNYTCEDSYIDEQDKKILRIKLDGDLSDDDVEKLKRLREKLPDHVEDLIWDIPSISNLMTPEQLEESLRDLMELNELKTGKNKLKWAYKIFESDIDDTKLRELEDKVSSTIKLRKALSRDWQRELLEKLLKLEGTLKGKLLRAIESVIKDGEALKEKIEFVDVFEEITLTDDLTLEDYEKLLTKAISRLSEGKEVSSFIEFIIGYLGLSKEARKMQVLLRCTTLNGKKLKDKLDFEKVKDFVGLKLALNRFIKRWNKLAGIVNIPKLKSEEGKGKYCWLEGLENLFNSLENLEEVHEYFRRLSETKDGLRRVFKLDFSADLLDTILEDIEAELEKVIRAKHLAETQKRLINYKKYLQSFLEKASRPHKTVRDMLSCLESLINLNSSGKEKLICYKESYFKLKTLEDLKPLYVEYQLLLKKLEACAPHWASMWKRRELTNEKLVPIDWRKGLWFNAVNDYVKKLVKKMEELKYLESKQEELINKIKGTKRQLIEVSFKLNLLRSLTEKQLQALRRWLYLVRKLGKGRGKYAAYWARQIKKEMKIIKDAIPVWIMPLYRVSEMIPAEFGSFDVVIIDEASQSDVRALVAVARGKKVVIVGDPEQTSPEAIGINRKDIRVLLDRYLKDFSNKDMFSLDTSLYDLAEVVLSAQGEIMLKEHFRCVPEIIEFSNKLCYDGKIQPVRNPSPDERLDPVLEAIYVEDGYRNGDINKREAEVICEKVREIVSNPKYKGKTLGVISLIGHEQARYILKIINNYITPEQQEEVKLRIGTAYSFQGDERDIIILSMVAAPNERSDKGNTTFSYDNKIFRQRFNVAVSRARDKLIVVHSIKMEELSPIDIRFKLLYYVYNRSYPSDEPAVKVKGEVTGKPFESDFEEKVYEWLTQRGYRVTPRVQVGRYRIDLVVEGKNSRLGIECDGVRWHPPHKWWEDWNRQRSLERMGWTICRIWGSDFYRDPDEAMRPIIEKLMKLGIRPL